MASFLHSLNAVLLRFIHTVFKPCCVHLFLHLCRVLSLDISTARRVFLNSKHWRFFFYRDVHTTVNILRECFLGAHIKVFSSVMALKCERLSEFSGGSPVFYTWFCRQGMRLKVCISSRVPGDAVLLERGLLRAMVPESIPRSRLTGM